MTKLEAFSHYMSQFAAHRGADMQWVMEASSHGRIFSYAWDEAVKVEREACAKVCKNEEAQLLYQEGQLLPRGEPVLLKMASVANYCAAAIRARGEK
jgi:hypothetical protein